MRQHIDHAKSGARQVECADYNLLLSRETADQVLWCLRNYTVPNYESDLNLGSPAYDEAMRAHKRQIGHVAEFVDVCGFSDFLSQTMTGQRMSMATRKKTNPPSWWSLPVKNPGST